MRSLLKYIIPYFLRFIFIPFRFDFYFPHSPMHRSFSGPSRRLTFRQALILQLELSKKIRRFGWLGNYYEFGCFRGGSLILNGQIIKFFSIFYKELKNMKIFAFDSFQGLPEITIDDHNDPVWIKGAYSGSLEEVKKNVAKYRINNIEYIKGFYNDSLTEDLGEKMKIFPPSIIYIDVDLYSSTITILNWIDKIALPGTIVYFDDIWATGNHPDSGEQRAIIEYNSLDNSRGFLIEDPTSYGSKTVFRFLLKDTNKNAIFEGFD